ncbi:MAG TPA: GIY-YIG nuclease family protein [Thermoanaerobaculia bacterium]|nr:GIY-YIG nuclease family protein [Thermoanaerobaculia bacterium]
MLKLYYVYILASIHRVLYIGLTSQFEHRVQAHQVKTHPRSFTAKYNVDRLVYFEEFTQVGDALAREKQLKGWRRAKKIALIESLNPGWADLSTRGLEEAEARGELPEC